MDSRLNGHNSDVIQFARGAPKPSDDQLDTAGQTILQLIHRAAGFAEENSRHALEMAQKLSDQLRGAEDRIAELEADLDRYREKPIARSNGCIASTRRLRTDFFGRATASGACRSGAERKAPIRLELKGTPSAGQPERQRARGPGCCASSGTQTPTYTFLRPTPRPHHAKHGWQPAGKLGTDAVRGRRARDERCRHARTHPGLMGRAHGRVLRLH